MSSGASALAPLAPWALAGESIVGLARWQGAPPVFPVGLTRMPGPSLVAATRYTDSPVGAFVELIIGHPARLGLRFGWMISESIVTAEDARIGGRLNWGFPSERADLRLGGRRPHACAGVAIPRVLDAGRAEGHAASVARAGARAPTSKRRLHDRPRSPTWESAVRPRRDRGEAGRSAQCDRGPASRRDGVRPPRDRARCASSARPAQVARRPAEGARACSMV